jgi:cyclophilin family peptidyl-prolyl cis-trans isomerase
MLGAAVRRRIHSGLTRRARAIALSAAVAVAAASGCARRDRRAQAAAIAPPDPAAIFGGAPPARARLAFETDAGTIACEIEPARVPRAAALVVGLARGDADFRDARSGAVVRRPYYDGLTFFRRLPGELIQIGCAIGDGSGHPGFRIAVEPSARDAELLARPGVLLLAHYQRPPLREDPDPPPPGQVIGSQLAIALGPVSHNAGAVTVLGHCENLDVVRQISRVPKGAPAPVLRALRASW